MKGEQIYDKIALHDLLEIGYLRCLNPLHTKHYVVLHVIE